MSERGRPVGSSNRGLPDPLTVTKKLVTVKDDDKDLLIESHLNKIPDEYMQTLPPPQTFTDISKLFRSDYHILIEGKTGAGKTTLQLTLLNKYLQKGDTTILLRDDGGLEFMFLACFYPTRIFIPDEEAIDLKLIGFKADIERFKHPREIIQKTYDYTYPLNVIVYDVFCDTTAQRAHFYSKLFMALITTLQRMRKSQKRKAIFAIDELNDLIPPRGKGSPESAVTRGDIEMNIRKLRKHKVQVFATSHRFNQIGVDTRSQMEQIYFKKSYGYDVWDFLSKNLVTSSSKTFWGMVRRLLTLPRNQFVLFDENRLFDLYTFPDIPRPQGIDVEPLGSIPIRSSTKRIERDLYKRRIQVACLTGKGWKPKDIARYLGVMPSIIGHDLCEMRADVPDDVRDMLKHYDI